MKVKYILEKPNMLKMDMMDGDLKTYVAEKKYTMAEGIKKLQNNPGLSGRILKTVRKFYPSLDLNLKMFMNNIIHAEEQSGGVFAYEIKKRGRDVEVTIFVAEVYFIISSTMRNMMPRFHRKTHDGIDESKAKWNKWFEKELSRYHPVGEWKKVVIEA